MLTLPIEASSSSEETESETPKVREPSTSQTPSTSRESMYQRATDLLSNTSNTSDILNLDTQDELRVRLTRTVEPPAGTKTDEPASKRPILAKHCILKILADSVVSYAGIAKLIVDYTYKINSEVGYSVIVKLKILSKMFHIT